MSGPYDHDFDISESSDGLYKLVLNGQGKGCRGEL